MAKMPSSMEELVFKFIDQYKFIFFPEQWNDIFLDFSKNEVFVLLLVYRRAQVNMTEISEYMNIPLNTVTGVVSRLEKKKIVLRERSKEDKRVVTICLTDTGKQWIDEEIALFGQFFTKVMDSLLEEEKRALIGIAGKVFQTFSEEANKNSKDQKPENRIRHITIE